MTRPMKACTVRAPAKINLHLEVLGRRPDGFHELWTLFQSVGLWDELRAEGAPEGELDLIVRPAGVVTSGDQNLVVKAARALWEHGGIRNGARLTLTKKIPVGGGLGGGSADAAAALVALDWLWDLDFDASNLSRLAAHLGSDVPFFLHGGFALGVGRGEEVRPLPDLVQGSALIVAPSVSVSTAEVYARVDLGTSWHDPDPKVYSLVAGSTSAVPWRALRNELQPIVTAGWPEVGAVLEKLDDCAASLTAVTGSGSAVFALFAEEGDARAAAAKLPDRWHSFIAPVLPRELARLEVRPS